MAIKRIALFGKYTTNYDEAMLSGLASGFRQCGIEATHLSNLLNGPILERFCRHYKPDAILEINRGRADLPELPRSIMHIAWIQDPISSAFNPYGSDLTYFLSRPETIGYPQLTGVHYGVLYTGIDPEATNYGPLPPESDFSMIGYMPRPISMVDSSIALSETKTVPVRLIADHFTKAYCPLSGNSHDSNIELLRHVLHDAFGVALRDIPELLVKEIADDHVRALDRQVLLEMALDLSKSLRIYGASPWLYWEQFKNHYKHYISEPQEIQRVYQSTRLNLHNNPHGFGVHSRVLECMATGGAIMINSTPHDDFPGGIRAEFEPDVHYIPYTRSDFKDTARRWLGDEAKRQALGECAAQYVREKHTWKNRAQQIISDLALA